SQNHFLKVYASGCVIGRGCTKSTIPSLLPSQNHFLKVYASGCVIGRGYNSKVVDTFFDEPKWLDHHFSRGGFRTRPY
ncbi:MAG: hypothetical protein WCR46_23885, partial [Deltaproteobacteria bacterium]